MFEQWVIDAEKMYNEGLTYTAIGKKLNKNRQVIAKHLKAKRDNKVIINHNMMNKDMYHNIFDNIDTEEKAYWLGFLYADGYISNTRNEISLSLKETDIDHIEKFKNFLNVKNKIQRKVKDNTYISYSLSVRSKILKSDLIKNGCFPNKSKILSFPTELIVPNSLLPHFIRGYVDGDGSITTSNKGANVSLEILGNEFFLTDLTKIELFHKNKLYSFKHSDIKRVSYSGDKAMKILNYLYKDATIYLKRKYELYDQWYRRFQLKLQKTEND